MGNGYSYISKHSTTMDAARGRFVGSKPPLASWGERNGGRPQLAPSTKPHRGKQPTVAVRTRREATAARLMAWCTEHGNREFNIAEAAAAVGDPASKPSVRQEDVRWIVHGGGWERVGYAGWRMRVK